MLIIRYLSSISDCGQASMFGPSGSPKIFGNVLKNTNKFAKKSMLILIFLLRLSRHNKLPNQERFQPNNQERNSVMLLCSFFCVRGVSLKLPFNFISKESKKSGPRSSFVVVGKRSALFGVDNEKTSFTKMTTNHSMLVQHYCHIFARQPPQGRDRIPLQLDLPRPCHQLEI